jgi:hypothetical protein
MNETEKLSVLIPHWVEHNNEHAQEFRDWAARAGETAQDILDAAEAMNRVNTYLLSAQEKLGGSIPHRHG